MFLFKEFFSIFIILFCVKYSIEGEHGKSKSKGLNNLIEFFTLGRMEYHGGEKVYTDYNVSRRKPRSSMKSNKTDSGLKQHFKTDTAKGKQVADWLTKNVTNTPENETVAGPSSPVGKDPRWRPTSSVYSNTEPVMSGGLGQPNQRRQSSSHSSKGKGIADRRSSQKSKKGKEVKLPVRPAPNKHRPKRTVDKQKNSKKKDPEADFVISEESEENDEDNEDNEDNEEREKEIFEEYPPDPYEDPRKAIKKGYRIPKPKRDRKKQPQRDSGYESEVEIPAPPKPKKTDVITDVETDNRQANELSDKAAEQNKKDFMETIHERAINKTFIMTGRTCNFRTCNVYEKRSNTGEFLYEVCFDEESLTPIYARHTIVPFTPNRVAGSRKHVSNRWRPSYKFYGFGIDKVWKVAAQEKTFDDYLGYGQTYVQKNLAKGNYYAHAHLAPFNDFEVANHQEATFENHNCVPGKQSVNNGNWKRLEGWGRGIVEETQENLYTYTGVLDHLEVAPLNGGKKIKAFLDKGRVKLKIPKYHWKLYIHKRNGTITGFITSNDNYLQPDGERELMNMCKTNCDIIGFEQTNDVHKGKTVCCTYDELRRHVLFLPEKFPANSPLLVRQSKLKKKK